VVIWTQRDETSLLARYDGENFEEQETADDFTSAI